MSQKKEIEILTAADSVEDKLIDYLEVDRMQTAQQLGGEIFKKIQTPLMMIRGRAETLHSQLDHYQKQNAKGILDQIEKLEQMLGSFEQFVQPKSEVAQKINAFELVEDLILFFQYRLSFAKIQVINAVSPDTVLPASESHLRQILVSLFLNSIEALEESKIESKTIFFHFHSNKDGGFILSVEDNGPGINESIVRSIFKPFLSTKEGHVGLSLAIAKKMAQSQGWQLKITSRPQKATCAEILISV